MGRGAGPRALGAPPARLLAFAAALPPLVAAPAAAQGAAARHSASGRPWVHVGPARVFSGAAALLEDPPAPRSVALLYGVRFAPNLGASLRALHLLGGGAAIVAGGVAQRGGRPAQGLQEALRISMAQRHGWPLRLAAIPADEAAEAVRACASRGLRTICVETDTAGLRSPPQPIDRADLIGGCPGAGVAFVFGAEDEGTPEHVAEECELFVSIPTVGRGSLNVSHAVALAMYEYSRQLRVVAPGGAE